MAKYDPLATFLRRQRRAEIELSFRDIERIVGGMLPKAAGRETWWAADDGPVAQPQQRVLALSGFTARPEIRAERVVFVRHASEPS